MIYTVGEMAQKLGVPASTLRYYDKEGLLPFVERSSGGIRMFRENDFEWLQVIRCMKKAGMSMLLGIAIMILAGLELIYIGIMWASFLLIPVGFIMAVIGFFSKDS